VNDDVEVRAEHLESPVAARLIAVLNAELAAMYDDPTANHFRLDPEEVAPGRGAFLVAWRGDAAIGCGAVRLLDPRTAEIKRMYVAPGLRGGGIGRRVLEALEAEARRLGATRLLLETGKLQDRALALYRSYGFEVIPAYGEYVSSPHTSICMAKAL
jgi:putative acetyltransferase